MDVVAILMDTIILRVRHTQRQLLGRR